MKSRVISWIASVVMLFACFLIFQEIQLKKLDISIDDILTTCESTIETEVSNYSELRLLAIKENAVHLSDISVAKAAAVSTAYEPHRGSISSNDVDYSVVTTSEEYFEQSEETEIVEVDSTEYEEDAVEEYSWIYSPQYFKKAGRISWGDWSWTWYSERVLPGYGLHIPGRYTDDLGYVRDEDGYLCLASDVLDKGAVVDTPFGSPGKVYDCGCGNNYTMDVYVGW